MMAPRGLLLFVLLLFTCSGSARANLFDDFVDFITAPFNGFFGGDPPDAGEISLPDATTRPIPLSPSGGGGGASFSPPPVPIRPVASPPPPVILLPPPSPPPPAVTMQPPAVLIPIPSPSPPASPSPSPPSPSQQATQPLGPATAIPEKHRNKPPPPPVSPLPSSPSSASASGSPSDSGSSSSSTTTIIIAVACSVGGVILIVAVTLLCCYFKKRNGKSSGAATRGSRRDLEQGQSGVNGVNGVNGQKRSSRSTTNRKTTTATGAYASKSRLQSFDPYASSYNVAAATAGVGAGEAPAPGAISTASAPSAVGGRMGPMAAAAAVSTVTGLRPPKPREQQREQEVSSPAPRHKNDATAQWLGLAPAAASSQQQRRQQQAVHHHRPTASQSDSLVSKSSRLSSSYDIDFSSIQLDREIGKGSFGKIFKATWNETAVAVKFLVEYDPKDRFHVDGLSGEQYQRQQTEKLMQTLEAEAEILSVMRHPNVVQYLGVCTDPESMCIVTEYCGNGSLADVIRKKTLTWDMATRMMLDAATGMLYLHSRDILHCDLKSNNILVDTHYRTKICDFNMSKLIEESTGSSINIQNPRWLAPEICEGSDTHSTASDVYSFGIVMWEVLTGKIPWRDSKPWEIVQLIKDGGRPSTPNFWDCTDARGDELIAFDEYVKLMCACWDGNSYSRPTFQEVVRELKEIVLFTSGGGGRGGGGGAGGGAGGEGGGDDDGGADPRLFSNASTKVLFSNLRSK